MPKGGLEPPQRFHHQNLNLARLPIPPLRQSHILSSAKKLVNKSRSELKIEGLFLVDHIDDRVGINGPWNDLAVWKDQSRRAAYAESLSEL